MKKTVIGFAIFLLLCCATLPVYAQDPESYERRVPGPSGEAVMADLIFVRPLSIIGLALGTVMSVVATPFALASGTTDTVYDKLLAEPYSFTVCRPLGTGF